PSASARRARSSATSDTAPPPSLYTHMFVQTAPGGTDEASLVAVEQRRGRARVEPLLRAGLVRDATAPAATGTLRAFIVGSDQVVTRPEERTQTLREIATVRPKRPRSNGRRQVIPCADPGFTLCRNRRSDERAPTELRLVIAGSPRIPGALLLQPED